MQGNNPSNSTSSATSTSAGSTHGDGAPRRGVGAFLRSRGVIIGLVAVILFAVGGTTVGYATMSKSVTLVVDGQEQSASIFSGTVGDVLESEGIEVGERDQVVPDVDTRVEDGSRIAVSFARPIELTLDGETDTHWVRATDVEGALAEIGVRADGADVSVSRSAGISREGLALEVVSPKSLTVVVGASWRSERELAAVTVADVLEQLEIELGERDKVKPALSAEVAEGDTITVVRVRDENRRVEGERIPFETVEVDDDTLEKGETEVEREGRDGLRDATYVVTIRNGEIVERRLAWQSVTREPVDERVLVGTKEPEPEPEATPSTPSTPNLAGGSTVWDQLAKCESGGNWATNTGNGYYGGLQFSLPTWQAYGGQGMPHENSREQQIAVAEKLRNALGGYGSWPHCSQQLGLPQ